MSTCMSVLNGCDNEVISLLHMCNIQVFHPVPKNAQHNQLILLWGRQVNLLWVKLICDTIGLFLAFIILPLFRPNFLLQ